MKKFLFLISAFFLLAIVFLSGNTFASSPVTGHKIVIDAGHGGSDGGSLACSGLREADANLDIAQRLQDLLENDGATGYMTREQDVDRSNRDRYEYANSTDGEVLVSIHLNGSTDTSVDGNLGLYGKKNKDQAFATSMQSSMFARLSATTPNFTDYGVTNFASGVLLKSNMPATIQETVFISNSEECALLTDGTEERQQEIAQALYESLSDWFSGQTTPPDDGGDGGTDEPDCPPNSKSPKCG